MFKTNNPNIGCGCLLIVLVLNIIIGGFSFDYVLWALCGKDVPFLIDGVCGLFLGEFTVPLAIVLWILHFFIEYPCFK